MIRPPSCSSLRFDCSEELRRQIEQQQLETVFMLTGVVVLSLVFIGVVFHLAGKAVRGVRELREDEEGFYDDDPR